MIYFRKINKSFKQQRNHTRENESLDYFIKKKMNKEILVSKNDLTYGCFICKIKPYQYRQTDNLWWYPSYWKWTTNKFFGGLSPSQKLSPFIFLA